MKLQFGLEKGAIEMFNPGLKIGEEINNDRLCDIFECSPQGGMRKSNTTNTLVLVADYINGIYHDKWINRVLHYTGMGLSGDQDINYKQNRTLKESSVNDVDIHLFEVMETRVYTYCGRVHLVGSPYTEKQLDQDGHERTVWMFPIQPIPDNDVAKPPMYVFKDRDDYLARGLNVDKEYAAYLLSLKQKRTRGANSKESKKISNIIIHKTFGEGTIIKRNNNIITVKFGNETRELNYKICIEKGLIQQL